jgi:DNA-binding response OmpR family regulator
MIERAANKGKILIVDDSEIVRELVKVAFEEVGYTVVTVDNPLGFSNVLRRERPSIALVDVTMPALVGNKLVEIALRHRAHDCPIVLFSDRSEKELQQLTRSSGASGYIRKTGDMVALVAAVEKYLRG